jgi:hypothetical protein
LCSVENLRADLKMITGALGNRKKVDIYQVSVTVQRVLVSG